jgi:AcrR family transcriptional regulator
MSTRPDQTPIWLHPEPGNRQPRFTRGKIAAAALEIADAEGFDAVSMRRVAARLGAGTMTLYHYVRTKDDLIALMDDALMGEVLVPDVELRGDWRAALTAIARRTRAIFVRHPWALLSMLGTPPGPNGMRHFEQCLAAVASTPLDTAGKLELLALVDDFVFGHALRTGEARVRARASPKARAAFQEYARRQFDSGRYPQTAALFGNLSPHAAEEQIVGLAREEERFESGLHALLEGAVARTSAHPRRRPGKKRPAAKLR